MKDKLRDILCFVYGAKPIRPKEIIIKKAEELILSLIKGNIINISDDNLCVYLGKIDAQETLRGKINKLREAIDDCMKALTEGGEYVQR